MEEAKRATEYIVHLLQKSAQPKQSRIVLKSLFIYQFIMKAGEGISELKFGSAIND